MADLPKGVPPVTPKSIKKESLDRYTRADTGGDPYNRARGNYSKNAPERPDSGYFDYES